MVKKYIEALSDCICKYVSDFKSFSAKWLEEFITLNETLREFKDKYQPLTGEVSTTSSRSSLIPYLHNPEFIYKNYFINGTRDVIIKGENIDEDTQIFLTNASEAVLNFYNYNYELKAIVANISYTSKDPSVGKLYAVNGDIEGPESCEIVFGKAFNETSSLSWFTDDIPGQEGVVLSNEYDNYYSLTPEGDLDFKSNGDVIKMHALITVNSSLIVPGSETYFKFSIPRENEFEYPYSDIYLGTYFENDKNYNETLTGCILNYNPDNKGIRNTFQNRSAEDYDLYPISHSYEYVNEIVYRNRYNGDVELYVNGVKTPVTLNTGHMLTELNKNKGYGFFISPGLNNENLNVKIEYITVLP